ncbi:ABC transporter [Shewanella sp. NFH-SH190041]|uniref:substrate-binding periplasmic protein n=1 Tax=Shewanella sp. NFH-SH190041 TaxID=2950245 RepID=UPI0021C4885B|nr:transporter substrate-binding domain-containing protein [Shewanella sp. NFH-SH190041]BDM64652.1 ABC transporter [Shewanella sp. NFH-SH190041]
MPLLFSSSSLLRALRKWALLLNVALLSCCVTFSVRGETLHLISILWPPYASQFLPEQGASVAVVKAAVRAMGHDVKVDFYPWRRAIKLASNPTSRYLGILPVYDHHRGQFLLSAPISYSPLGLIERRFHPISWLTAQDLRQYSLATVRNDNNARVLDALLAPQQRLMIATSDLHNVKALASARIDAAVMDTRVFTYLLRSPAVASFHDALQVNKKLLANPGLHVAFQLGAKGRRWQRILDQGLAKINVPAVMQGYLGVAMPVSSE